MTVKSWIHVKCQIIDKVTFSKKIVAFFYMTTFSWVKIFGTFLNLYQTALLSNHKQKI